MSITNAGTQPLNILVIGRDPEILKVVLRLLNDHQPNDHQPNDHQPNDHQPNDHQPNDHQPNDHQPNVHQPNDHQPSRYHAIGSTDPDQARSLFADSNIDLVLITNGIEATLDASLREEFLTRRPGIRILQHFGGGSGLLFGEIAQALATS